MKTHMATRFLILTIVLSVQVVFLSLIIRDSVETENYVLTAPILLIIVTLIFGYRYLDVHHLGVSYHQISVAIWVPLGAVMCYSLSIYFDLGPVISAGMIGTLASFLPTLQKEPTYLKKVSYALYCGAFVGMSSIEIAPSITFILTAGCIAGIVYIFSKNLFVSIGGKLGTIAFVGVTVVSLLNWIFV